MKKRFGKAMARTVSAFKSLTVSTIPLPVCATPPRRCNPKVTATFVQSWLSASWTDAQWDTELEDMIAAGITCLIFSDVAIKDKKSNGGQWTTYYPSQLTEFGSQDYRGDVLEKALNKCQEHTIQVILGTGGYTDWDITAGLGSTYMNFCTVGAKIAEEIYNMYYNKYADTICGWYFVPEFNNNVLLCTPYARKFARGINVILAKLTQLNPDLPFLMSPYHTKYYGAASLRNTQNFWNNFFSQTNFRPGDIFSPQDAVGAGWIDITDLESVTQMYRKVVDEANKGVILWANCENFAQCHSGSFLVPSKTEYTAFITSPLNRFVSQMNIVSPYVDNIIVFSYNHYYSPQKIQDRVYNDTYIDYLRNYELDTQKPTAPTRIDTSYRSNGQLAINWNAGTDNIGIAGYRVYKNGNFLVRRDVSSSVADPTNYPLYSCLDKNFSTSEKTIYEVECFDGAGNFSDKMAIVVDGANPDASRGS